MQHKSKAKKIPTMLICILLGVSLRLIYCIKYPVQPRDAYTYASIIRNWEINGVITENSRIHQFSLLILKIPYHFFNYNIIKGGIIINMIVGLLIIIVGIKITERITKNSYIDLFVGMLLATHPYMVRYSCVFLRENLYMFFSLLALSSLIKYGKGISLRNLFLISFFGALAFLCRLEGFEMIGIFFLVILYVIFAKKIGFSIAFIHCLLFVLFFFMNIYCVCHILGLDMIQYNKAKTRIDIEKMNLKRY